MNALPARAAGTRESITSMIVQKELYHPNETEPGKPAEETDLRPGPVDESDLLDWDVYLESPPPRPERTVLVSLEYAGRDVPLPLHDLSDQ
jgi:hypothetical protein